MMAPERLRRLFKTSLPGRLALRVLSWGYGAAVVLRRFLYEARVLPSRGLPAKTVCIGNLTAGGTGKTSAVLLAAQTLRRNDHKVAILSRGYKRTDPKKEVVVLLDGRNVPWQEAGDEPWMLHHALAGLQVPVLVSPDRFKAGTQALEHYDCKFLLLDDGYQHFRLRRDLDIVLLNALDPFGGGSLLPLGDLREPLGGLSRAGLIVITHADLATPESLGEIRRRVRGVNAAAPILEAVHRPDFIFDVKAEKRQPLKRLKGKEVSAFCAIGDPQAFQAQLGGIGAKVTQFWRYPDHHPFTQEELRSIESVRRGNPLVTTFKDLPRLPACWRDILAGEVLALAVAMEITAGKETWETELCRLPGKP